MEFSSLGQSSITPIVSPCSRYFATITNDNINIKDASYLDLKDYSKINIKQKQKASSSVTIKFSPDSQLIAVKFFKKINVYGIQGNLKVKIQLDNEQIQNMIWSQDPGSIQLLVFYKNSSCCHIYNLQDGSISIIKSPKFNNQNGCSFSKGTHPGVFMAMLQRNGVKDSIGIYFTRNWQLVNYINLQTSFDIGKIQFSEVGTILAIERIMNFKMFVIDMFRGVFEQYGDKPHVLGFCCHKFSNSSQFLALGAHDNCIHLINTATWKLIVQLQISVDIDLNKTIWLKEQNNRFYPVQVKGKIPKKDEKQSNAPLGISIFEFSPNDEYLAVKNDSMYNSVFIYSIKNLELVTVITCLDNVKDFEWIQNSNGEIDLCIVNGNQKLLFWKSNDPQDSIYEIKIPTANNGQLKISQLLLQAKDRKLIFYSSITKKYVYSSF